MKFTLDEIAGRAFTIESAVEWGDLAVALGPSAGVTGFVDVTKDGTQIRATTPTSLSLSAVRWPMPNGVMVVEGDMRLTQPDVDVRIAPGFTGRVVVHKGECEHLRLGMPAAAAIDMDDVVVAGADLRADAGCVRVAIDAVHLGSITLPHGGGAIQLMNVRAHNVVVKTDVGGVWEIDVELLEAQTFHGPLASVHAGAEGVRLEMLRIQSDGRISASRLASGRTRVRIANLGKLTSGPPSTSARRALPAEVELLALLSGNLRADVVTDVHIPIIQSRRANHPVRLEIDKGMIQWQRLEHCLAKLEDAVLDFAIENERLCLIKDIPLVPFDRTTLASWALPGDELETAEFGWVRLARLAAPTVEIETRSNGTDDGARFLNEVSATNIHLGASVAAHAGWKLSSGGTLRLGKTKEPNAVPAIANLVVAGEIVYRPDQQNDPGSMEANADAIRLEVEGVSVSDHLLTANVVVDHAKARCRFEDITPTSIDVEIKGTCLRDLLIERVSRGDVASYSSTTTAAAMPPTP